MSLGPYSCKVAEQQVMSGCEKMILAWMGARSLLTLQDRPGPAPRPPPPPLQALRPPRLCELPPFLGPQSSGLCNPIICFQAYSLPPSLSFVSDLLNF